MPETLPALGQIPADYFTGQRNITSGELVALLNQAAAALTKKATLVIGHADLTDSDGAQTFAYAAALPAGAVITGVGIDVTEGFTDGAAGVFTADLGDGTVIDSMLNGADIAAVAPVATPQGATPSGLVGAITPELTVLADVNVDTATAGALTVEIYYVDGAAL